MLLNLAQWLQGLYPELGFLRVFQYLTFRGVMAALTALQALRDVVAVEVFIGRREHAEQHERHQAGV